MDVSLPLFYPLDKTVSRYSCGASSRVPDGLSQDGHRLIAPAFERHRDEEDRHRKKEDDHDGPEHPRNGTRTEQIQAQ